MYISKLLANLFSGCFILKIKMSKNLKVAHEKCAVKSINLSLTLHLYLDMGNDHLNCRINMTVCKCALLLMQDGVLAISTGFKSS